MKQIKIESTPQEFANFLFSVKCIKLTLTEEEINKICNDLLRLAAEKISTIRNTKDEVYKGDCNEEKDIFINAAATICGLFHLRPKKYRR